MKRLIQKAQRGNDQAFLKVFHHYESDLYRMAYVYVKNPDDALDVVQEVAYQAFKKIGTLREPDYVKTWLVKITINCALNLMKQRQKVIQLKPEFDEIVGKEEQDIALTLTLADMMETLCEEERSIIVLKYYQDYTFQQISDLLELPIGTVKSTLYRAVEKLRNELKEADYYGS
ncbi:sigma-70 family RNA polymerase sigma factor [Exiguobacterium sp. SH1S21]|uniref:sigma-70 family RNA polymerase sigma factor n=1 Tax=Exiguobacterium sp. SH1S21 TaxID=2510953 RepID=UPI001038DE0B|nr:sigma-70 family RNA polymerase sigma factor [Exiguobacterium sp. SH1S21]TCI53030.1 sigma-70 family RNA polymerase sigma factor [Exiguobacterium sp. SH1S21]